MATHHDPHELGALIDSGQRRSKQSFTASLRRLEMSLRRRVAARENAVRAGQARIMAESRLSRSQYTAAVMHHGDRIARLNDRQLIYRLARSIDQFDRHPHARLDFSLALREAASRAQAEQTGEHYDPEISRYQRETDMQRGLKYPQPDTAAQGLAALAAVGAYEQVSEALEDVADQRGHAEQAAAGVGQVPIRADASEIEQVGPPRADVDYIAEANQRGKENLQLAELGFDAEVEDDQGVFDHVDPAAALDGPVISQGLDAIEVDSDNPAYAGSTLLPQEVSAETQDAPDGGQDTLDFGEAEVLPPEVAADLAAQPVSPGDAVAVSTTVAAVATSSPAVSVSPGVEAVAE